MINWRHSDTSVPCHISAPLFTSKVLVLHTGCYTWGTHGPTRSATWVLPRKCGTAQRARVGFEPQTPGIQVLHANHLGKGIFPGLSSHGGRSIGRIVTGLSIATLWLSFWVDLGHLLVQTRAGGRYWKLWQSVPLNHRGYKAMKKHNRPTMMSLHAFDELLSGRMCEIHPTDLRDNLAIWTITVTHPKWVQPSNPTKRKGLIAPSWRTSCIFIHPVCCANSFFADDQISWLKKKRAIKWSAAANVASPERDRGGRRSGPTLLYERFIFPPRVSLITLFLTVNLPPALLASCPLWPPPPLHLDSC